MLFNVDVVDSSINYLSNGKASGLDELAVKHLRYAHPALVFNKVV